MTTGLTLIRPVDHTRISCMVIGMDQPEKIITSVRKLTARAITGYVRDGCEFEAGQMSGVVGAAPDGELRGKWLDIYRRDRERVDYTIMSYSTPIAWHREGGWTVATYAYSKRHRALVEQLFPRAERRT